MEKPNKVILYLVCIFACVALYVGIKLNALYFILLLTALPVIFILKNKNERDKGFLVTIIVLIFISRLFLSLVVMNARGPDLSQDEGLFSKKALLEVYENRKGEKLGKHFEHYFGDRDMVIRYYGYNLYTYTLATFYRIFGYQIQAARFINTFFNVLVFLLFFYLARELFGRNTARIASSIFSFLPSMALWSVMIGVDMVMLLALIAYMFSLVKLFDKKKIRWVIVMAMALYIMGAIRPHIRDALVIITVSGVFIKIWEKLTVKGKVVAGGALGIIFIAFMNSPLLPLASAKFRTFLDLLVEWQRAFAVTDDAGYLIYPAHCYQGVSCSLLDFAGAYAKGMYYAFFSPFPWQVESKLQLMAYPQQVMWYFMAPFIIYGLYLGIQKNRIFTIMIMLYTFLIFSILAVVQGNIGALFRHKDMVAPFLLIYFAVAVDKILRVKNESPLHNI